MLLLSILFWICLLCFFQTWLFYPLLARLIAYQGNRYPPQDKDETSLPGVSVVLPVYNASQKIKKKVENLLQLDYPNDLFEIIIVSDGSTDETIDTIRSLQNERIQSFQLPSNQGKSAAQNFGVDHARFPILLFTDVDSIMTPSSLRKMVLQFHNPDVGCVGANVKYKDTDWDSSKTQTTYWKQEQLLREMESGMGVLISTCGSAIAVRKKYFRKLDPDTGDDFIIPLDLALAGYKTLFASDALVFDQWPARGFLSELKVRRRITVRNLLGLYRRRKLLNPLRYPLLSFSLISHKVLRWLSPLLMLMLFLFSVLLCQKPLYNIIFYLQIVLYGLSACGVVANYFFLKIPIIGQLGTFVWTNVGLLYGLFSFLFGWRVHAYKN